VPRLDVCAFLVFPLARLSAVFEAFGQQFSLSLRFATTVMIELNGRWAIGVSHMNNGIIITLRDKRDIDIYVQYPFSTIQPVISTRISLVLKILDLLCRC
jgi:hypothetical protein